MSQNPINADQARAAAQSILARAVAEPEFLTALTAQPVETLQGAGFNLDDAREFSQELATGEVAGYARCSWTCDRYSCWATWCGNVPFTN